MRVKIKKAISLVLAVIFMVGIMPTEVFGAEEPLYLKYDFAGNFSEGLAVVEFDGKYGYIDKTGKEIIPPKYDYTQPFNNGVAIALKDGKIYLIDKYGKET